MKCALTAAPGSPTRTITLRRAGAETALARTVARGATACDAAALIDFAAGQTIDWQATKGSGTAAASDVGCLLE